MYGYIAKMRNITVQRPFRVRLQKENTKYSRTTAINVRLQNKKCEIEPYTLSQTYMVRKDFFYVSKLLYPAAPSADLHGAGYAHCHNGSRVCSWLGVLQAGRSNSQV